MNYILIISTSNGEQLAANIRARGTNDAYNKAETLASSFAHKRWHLIHGAFDASLDTVALKRNSYIFAGAFYSVPKNYIKTARV